MTKKPSVPQGLRAIRRNIFRHFLNKIWFLFKDVGGMKVQVKITWVGGQSDLPFVTF